MFTKWLITVGLSVGCILSSAAENLLPAAPTIAAGSYLLMDAKTGDILIEHNIDKRLPPASLTKMMTAYVAEVEISKGRLTLEETTRISEKAWRTGGSKMWVKEGDDVAIGEILKGIIVASGNDSSVALAEHIAGDESVFAELMNQYANQLGMNNTQFKNASGLPMPVELEGQHYSTARDLAILARNIISQDEELYKLYALKDYTYNNITTPNRNSLLRQNPLVDGLKTGHTDAAGYCLVASAQQNNTRFITVVMNTSSPKARASESQKLLTYGFRFFHTVSVYQAEQQLATQRIWKGQSKQIELGVKEAIVLSLQKGLEDKIEAKLELNPIIEAPVKKGDVLGTMRLLVDGEQKSTHDIIALQNVEQAGFFARLWDSVLMFFSNLFN
jgi:serine-type D-Ala-D-Ala carboxypeptidase (penicillin-binding protein 5/6)